MNPPHAPVSLLQQREIEARLIKPLIDNLAAEFDRDRVLAVVAETIKQLAREHGETLATQGGRNDLAAFKQVKDTWQQGGALELTVLRDDAHRLDFNVTRCKYAEMYRRLGMEDLGALLSCNRDFCLSEGFNRRLRLTRTQTILQGADHCDFRYVLQDDA